MYDYLLVVGPGRSGSEFLYRILKSHADFVFPEIKEGGYYRSSKAFKRVWPELQREPGKLLCDITNSAYRDPSLLPRVTALLEQENLKILVVVLVRDYHERALSMMKFRKSRGEPSALFGNGHLERAVVRDRLTPKKLANIFRIETDILTFYFPALVTETDAVLEILASLCGTPKFSDVPQGAVNASVDPRYIWFSTLGWLFGKAMYQLGFRRLKQRIKDSELVKNVFFVKPSGAKDKPCLSEESRKVLEDSYLECRLMIEKTSEKLGEGIYFRKFNHATHDCADDMSPPPRSACLNRSSLAFDRLL